MLRTTASLIAAALLTACAGTPAVQSGFPSVAPALSTEPATSKSTLPGQYSGSTNDSQIGKHGKGTADLSQAGKAVGGAFGFHYPSQSIVGSAALNVKGDALSGIFSAPVGSVECTFTLAATYDAQTHMLAGTYTAKHGCTGESGNFHLKERCYYIDGARTHFDGRVRPAAGGLKPC